MEKLYFRRVEGRLQVHSAHDAKDVVSIAKMRQTRKNYRNFEFNFMDFMMIRRHWLCEWKQKESNLRVHYLNPFNAFETTKKEEEEEVEERKKRWVIKR